MIFASSIKRRRCKSNARYHRSPRIVVQWWNILTSDWKDTGLSNSFKYVLAWNAKRDKSVENQKVSCIIENIGFAINMCRTVLFMGKNCVRLTSGEVNILVDKLTIYFCSLKLAAEIYRL